MYDLAKLVGHTLNPSPKLHEINNNLSDIDFWPHERNPIDTHNSWILEQALHNPYCSTVGPLHSWNPWHSLPSCHSPLSPLEFCPLFENLIRVYFDKWVLYILISEPRKSFLFLSYFCKSLRFSTYKGHALPRCTSRWSYFVWSSYHHQCNMVAEIMLLEDTLVFDFLGQFNEFQILQP